MSEALRYLPLDALLLVVLLGVGVAAAITAPALRRGDRRAAAVRASRALLAGAILAVLAVTLADGTDTGQPVSVNLILGSGVRSALDNLNQDLGLLNLVGNVAMFVPVGALLPLAFDMRWRTAVAASAGLSASIEVQQLVFGRIFDVDDVLLNTIGAAIGAAIGVAFAHHLKSMPETDGKRESPAPGTPA